MEQTINKTSNMEEYRRAYYSCNKITMLENAQRWREANSGKYIYFIVNEDGASIYTGSYLDRPIVERISFHLHGHSNLHMDAMELQEKYQMSTVLFKNFKEYGLNKQDIHFLENYYKTEFVNVLGNNKVRFNEDELSMTKEELIQLAESVPYEEFDIDKYLA
ncbi:hypothetical protein [Clostridium beijerinckii]|uniref:GIY-YIG domain-containing protein n=1 Tax=Clostridium beijerinckii TaxID=1520 RepID=A0AAE5H041_CLOBE|nr:hypothetical protein [Clostridium beijerinckii]NSB12107.1 hypothetical protein [Clostridium beijerinckii]OOM27441.1 hypothetical protein CLOBE_29990 [Clostridium beijerinckii]